MSDFGRAGDDGSLSTGDWIRYGLLAFFGSLVFLVVLGPRQGVFLMLLAFWLLVATSVTLVVAFRRRHS